MSVQQVEDEIYENCVLLCELLRNCPPKRMYGYTDMVRKHVNALVPLLRQLKLDEEVENLLFYWMELHVCRGFTGDHEFKYNPLAFSMFVWDIIPVEVRLRRLGIKE